MVSRLVRAWSASRRLRTLISRPQTATPIVTMSVNHSVGVTGRYSASQANDPALTTLSQPSQRRLQSQITEFTIRTDMSSWRNTSISPVRSLITAQDRINKVHTINVTLRQRSCSQRERRIDSRATPSSALNRASPTKMRGWRGAGPAKTAASHAAWAITMKIPPIKSSTLGTCKAANVGSAPLSEWNILEYIGMESNQAALIEQSRCRPGPGNPGRAHPGCARSKHQPNDKM